MADRGDLDRVLGAIDSLLPPGAPQEDGTLSPDAMRWSPVEQDDHPDTAPAMRDVRRYPDLPDELRLPGYHTVSARVTWSPLPVPDWVADLVRAQAQRAAGAVSGIVDGINADPEMFAACDSYDDLMIRLEHAFRRNRPRTPEPGTAAQAVIEARRNRNTGPPNAHGLDGRARRGHHPTRAAAPDAAPAPQHRWVPWRETLARRWVDEQSRRWVDELSRWQPPPRYDDRLLRDPELRASTERGLAQIEAGETERLDWVTADPGHA